MGCGVELHGIADYPLRGWGAVIEGGCYGLEIYSAFYAEPDVMVRLVREVREVREVRGLGW